MRTLAAKHEGNNHQNIQKLSHITEYNMKCQKLQFFFSLIPKEQHFSEMTEMKETPALYRFKNALKNFLFDHCFYSVDEYFIFLEKSV
jgi:hypothetical protein